MVLLEIIVVAVLTYLLYDYFRNRQLPENNTRPEPEVHVSLRRTESTKSIQNVTKKAVNREGMANLELQILKAETEYAVIELGNKVSISEGDLDACKEALCTLASHNKTKDLQALKETMTRLRTCCSSLSRGSAVEKIVAIYRTTAEVSSVLSVLSAYAAPFCNLMFLALSQVGKEDNKNMGQLAEEIIISDNMLEELPPDAHGLKDQFCNSQAFLNGIQNGRLELGNIAAHEVAMITNSVPIYQGVTYMSILERKIRQTSDAGRLSESDVIQKSQETLDDIELFSKLAALRNSILWQMYLLVIPTEHSQGVAAGIEGVMERNRMNATDTIGFLPKPRPENAILVSLFNPSERPCTMQLLGNIGLPFPNLASFWACPQNIVLSTPDTGKLKAHYSSRSANADHILLTKIEMNKEGRDAFNFESLDDDNHFSIRCTTGLEKYVYMRQFGSWDLSCRSKPKGKTGTWKIVRLANGKFVLSCKHFPKRFACGSLKSSINPEKQVYGVQGSVITCNIIPAPLAQLDIVKARS